MNGYDGVPIAVGDRVEMHPATDLWMRGARFGEVLAIRNGGHASVQLDAVHSRVHCTSRDVRKIS